MVGRCDLMEEGGFTLYIYRRDLNLGGSNSILTLGRRRVRFAKAGRRQGYGNL
jgi:hypothetical protein